MSDEKVFLTFEEAVKRLPDGDQIHTYRQSGPMLLGADWDREELLDLLRKSTIEESGENATRMSHGLVVNDDGYLFIETTT